MDMAKPHFHKQSMVDMHVKTIVTSGAFRILQSLDSGSEPSDDSYLAVDVSGHPLFELLAEVEALFHHCGGPAKALTGAALRRYLGPLCASGGLEKHDLDALSQRFRTTSLSTQAGDGCASDAGALRFFDFV